jgi:hypothetical protein
MRVISSLGRRLVAIAGVLAAVTVGSAVISSPAVHAGDCTLVRPYTLSTVLNEKAWADAHGYIGPMQSADDGDFEFALTLSQRQADELEESINGGCMPHVRYWTRGTVVSFGTGSTASFAGIVDTRVDGNYLGQDSHTGLFPLSSGCTSITCQENLVHDVDLFFPARAGSVISVSSIASAAATVNVADQFHQAHADFSVRYPVLRIPIP